MTFQDYGGVPRALPSREAHDLLHLVRDFASAELAPRAAAAEADGEFPADLVPVLGELGLLGLPYPARYGGGDQPHEVVLQVLEELARAWPTVALTVSVHTLSAFPIARYGTEEQRARWLPGMLAGEHLGAYCLSESTSGSDAAALRTTAEATPAGYRVDGAKAWITHAGVADRYLLMVRTGEAGSRGISCLVAEAPAEGLAFGPREHKMGFHASPTAALMLDGLQVPADHLLGREGDGFSIAMAALDTGRLGIAAVAVGLAQAALDVAVDYANERQQFGQSIIGFQGVSFLLADMATKVAAARALLLEVARRRTLGMEVTASAAMAKLFATDTAMAVATDAVQVLGGNGYTADYAVERCFREAKVLQIVEGTNQIQRMVIGRRLEHGSAPRTPR